jgi:hypothetical protein
MAMDCDACFRVCVLLYCCPVTSSALLDGMGASGVRKLLTLKKGAKINWSKDLLKYTKLT